MVLLKYNVFTENPICKLKFSLPLFRKNYIMNRLYITMILAVVSVFVSCQTKDPLAVTDAEYAVVTAPDNEFRILNVFERSDSLLLRTPSIDVDLSDTIWNYLAHRMCKIAQVDGVGIAAPQVGINRRIICVQRWDKKVSDDDAPWEFYFNPQIVEYSDSVARRNDGCLSVPDGDVYPQIDGFSYRATWVKVAYSDADGVSHEEKITHQYTAHIFQHEIDHLNGIMFFDRQSVENAVRNLQGN